MLESEEITICGIFGSADFQEYKTLYKRNKERGSFAYGALFVDNDGDNMTIKMPGVKKRHAITKEYDFFLGHTQAPTSVERNFTVNTSHPFSCGDWIVAHNGVLTNFEELTENFFLEYPCRVDSSLFPFLFEKVREDNPDETHPEIIATALSLIEGTFAIWAFNKKTKDIFLARQGSTLFFNKFTNTFSSINCKRGFEEADEGIVYQLTNEGITQVALFTDNSPFFIL